MTDHELAKRCIRQDVNAQKMLYDRYSRKMLSICFRYAKDQMEAEDVLQEGFIRVFDKIHQFNFKGSLEGWIRRVIVTTAINNYRQNLKHYHHMELEETPIKEETEATSNFNTTQLKFSAEELLLMIKSLPEGYQTIFNLYAIDGYSHKEISKMLDISEGTSKSQLSRARKLLQDMLKKKEALTNETA